MFVSVCPFLSLIILGSGTLLDNCSTPAFNNVPLLLLIGQSILPQLYLLVRDFFNNLDPGRNFPRKVNTNTTYISTGELPFTSIKS